MAHNSPETVANIAAKQDHLIAQREAQQQLVLKSLHQEHQEREAFVAELVKHEGLARQLFEKPEEMAKKLFDTADAVVKESNRRNLLELFAELRRLNRPIEPAFESIGARHGITPPAPTAPAPSISLVKD